MLTKLINWFLSLFEPVPPPKPIDYGYIDQSWSYNMEQHIELQCFLAKKEHYLKSIKWQAKREAVLSRDNYQCQLCHCEHSLEVHHMSGYNQIPNEPIACLITLCHDCHEQQHKIHGFPRTYLAYMNWNHPIKD